LINVNVLPYIYVKSSVVSFSLHAFSRSMTLSRFSTQLGDWQTLPSTELMKML